MLSNGQLLISGGDENGWTTGYKGDGISQSVLLNPVTETMSRASKMAYARWYPTLVGLPNGESLILGGRAEKPRNGGSSLGVRTPEIYNTETGKYRKLTGANSDLFEHSWYYPRAYIGNTGKVFIAQSGTHDIWRMNWTGKGSVVKNASTRGEVFNQQYPSVVYRPGKVLTLTKGKGAKILDISGNNAKISDTGSPGLQRRFSDTTVMSDGQVLLTGGSTNRQDLATAHYKAQIWSPSSGKWQNAASASKARLYHSTALLLPSGAVLVAGGGPPGPVINMNAEIFYPPYYLKKMVQESWPTGLVSLLCLR